MTLAGVALSLKGSSSSGNYGHQGIPGHVGGSAAGTNVSGEFTEADPQELNKHYQLKDKFAAAIDNSALNLYTSSGHDVVNRKLRKGSYAKSIHASEWRESEVKDLTTRLDDAFDKAPTVPHNMVVYRGVDEEAFAGLQKGDSFVDKGFVSTSIDRSEARTGMQVEIRVPKGTKGIYVEQVSAVPSELEMILNRGTKFKVLELNREVNRFGQPSGKVILEVNND
jgi:hypothetical protein